MSDAFLLSIYSFSFHSSSRPGDPTGNGGGFVFDCRCLSNPGRSPELAHLTGKDGAVKEMLDRIPLTESFLADTFRLVDHAIKNYRDRGFRDLSVSFGCTGGRHRSVYCAERMAEHYRASGLSCRVIHWQMEQEDPNFRKRRAMILAAGFGSRLRPLTDTVPKALITAGGRSMLDWTLDSLRKAGSESFVINAHHHADKIIDWSESRRTAFPDLEMVVSHEPEILGTGGGIRQAARWLYSPNPVLIHNADIWSDFDLRTAWDNHSDGDMATLIGMEREASSYLLVDEDNFLVGLGKAGEKRIVCEPHGRIRPVGFTGIHIVSPQFFEKLGKMDHFGIMECYLELARNEGRIRVHEVKGNWFDMGSVEKLGRLNHFMESAVTKK